MGNKPKIAWGRSADDFELTCVATAAAEYRAVWASMKEPPFAALFNNSVTDIRALDYLHYEGFDDPPCGIEGAALVCGEVLRQAAGLVWIIDHDGNWFIATPENEWPAFVLCPLIRLREIQFARTPQFGRYDLWLTRAVMDNLSTRGNDNRSLSCWTGTTKIWKRSIALEN
jgi:hypothetical protein